MDKLSLKAGGVCIKADFTFLLFMTLLFMQKDSAVTVCFFGMCLIHELGHAAALAAVGGRVSALVFSGTGIRMIPARDRLLPFGSELFVLFAGPAVNLILFAVLTLCGASEVFAALNLWGGLMNLLPCKVLDGGAVAALLASRSRHELLLLRLACAFEIILTAAVLAAVVFTGTELIPLLISLLICLISGLRETK